MKNHRSLRSPGIYDPTDSQVLSVTGVDGSELSNCAVSGTRYKGNNSISTT